MIKLLQLVVTSVKNALAVFAGIASGIPRLSSHLPQTHTQEFSLDIVRPDDLLVLTLDFYNLRLVPAGSSQQIKRVAVGNGFIVARFPLKALANRLSSRRRRGRRHPTRCSHLRLQRESPAIVR